MSGFSRLKTVAERYGVDETTVRRWANNPALSIPKIKRLGPNTVGLSNDELDAYDEKVIERDGAEK